MAEVVICGSRKQRIDQQYRELRAADPDEFQACVARASAIGINHRLEERGLTALQAIALTADIECALVECALRNLNRTNGGK